MAKSAKGGAYERQICKELSMWWSSGHRDDIFWRTAGSGGRATQRAKKGKATFGQEGDIQAVHPKGKPLMNVFSVELKRGYSKFSFADMLDKTRTTAPTMLEQFIEQAMRGAQQANAQSWLLIHRRDKKRAMVYLPRQMLRHLVPNLDVFEEFATMRFTLKRAKPKSPLLMSVAIIPLESFLKVVQPKDVRALARR